jgi:hypothetical protein
MITNHPLQHGPVERFAVRLSRAVDAYCIPACRALAEHIDRVGFGLDDPDDTQGISAIRLAGRYGRPVPARIV